MTQAAHHLHIRKRMYQKLETYPHPRRLVRIVDGMIYVTGIIGPLTSLPQLIEIWQSKNAAGVSVASWVGYDILTLLMLFYGLVHHERPIIVMQIAWLISNVAVTVGAIMYS